MAEGFRHSAGSDTKLSIVRYGRDKCARRELPNGSGSALMPGEAVQVSTDGDGDPVFKVHDGNEQTEVYVVIEARGQGMDAQTDDGYADEELTYALNPGSGAGLNLRVATGEDIEDGDALVPNSSGLFVEETDEGYAVAHADETMDLSGLDDPELVHTEVN